MRITIKEMKEMKRRGEKITLAVVYDYIMAKVVDQTGVPLILVGNSVGTMILGYSSYTPVTIEDVLHHTKGVARGVEHALLVADMPFMSYHTESDAVRNATRLVQEGGAHVVTMEGEGERLAERVKQVTECGIPVIVLIGLTDHKESLSGFEVQGCTLESAKQLLRDAQALEEAGAFAITLECIPAALAKFITERVNVITLGHGAGPYCDGQTQMVYPLVGLSPWPLPIHSKQYANVGDTIKCAVAEWISDVQAGRFPTEEQSYKIDEDILAELLKSD